MKPAYITLFTNVTPKCAEAVLSKPLVLPETPRRHTGAACLSLARQLTGVAGAGGTQRQRSGGARRGAALGRVTQAFGERPAEGNGHGDVEAAADHRQAKLFALRGGDAHAGVATDALARLVDDFGVGKILRETAPLASETIHVHVVLGGQGAD